MFGWKSRVVLEENLRLGDPGNFGSEALNMVLLTLQHLCGDEHWEVAVLHTDRFDVIVEPALDLFPDGIRPWLLSSR